MSEADFDRIAEMALKPTILYPSLIINLIAKFKIHGMAHITGGGLTENIPRSIPENLSVQILKDSWPMPEIFKWLKDTGNIKEADMYRIFNCGIGMVLIVDSENAQEIQDRVSVEGYKSFVIGSVKEKSSDELVTFI